MKTRVLEKETTNRYVFNKVYKINLERNGKIRCSYCPYHKGENKTTEWYGGFEGETIRYPNWKLVSKNRKQWMKKPTEIKKENHRWSKRICVDITW